ncbi:Putative hypoxia induced protein [Septoria linicola]|uniref:Hypoxia induced protein n=1 Tax=Septoria linicola TaxID=215465 RepID=A0A9Q9AG24_9PEZI|nr:putative hypoxia induced protein [Septoria linicola]USW48425.1 Putative hypoxia induced protein [Septoria linicola]
MSIPGNINTAPPPSSFDEDNEFYEESRMAKFKRRLKEEPLIPLGCALTCWALYEATRSIKSGDKTRTNRMFRRRIYAQGFTILAMVAGSAYYESDRTKRKQFDGTIADQQKKERHEAWLRELEARDEEEQELRALRNKLMKARTAEKQDFTQDERRILEQRQRKDNGQNEGGWGNIRSALEENERRRTSIVGAAMNLWQGRR